MGIPPLKLKEGAYYRPTFKRRGKEPTVRDMAARSETTRIMNLPRRDPTEPPPDLTLRYRFPGGNQRLRVIQNQALWEIEQEKGLLGAIGVGLGKTLIAFLAPSAVGALRPLLLVPPGVYPQTIRMWRDYAKHWKLPRLRIYPYSALSIRSGAFLLDTEQPDLLICDEAHLLKSFTAARTKRVIRYFKEHPKTRFVALSGTMTARSLKDYGHLCELALRERSPLPRDKHNLSAWARVIDPRNEPLPSDWDAVYLFDQSYTYDQEVVRAAFRERLTTTPGVVCSSSDLVQSSLRFILHHNLPFDRRLYASATTTQEGLGTRPDGIVFDEPVEEWRCKRQLSAGFYYYWDWGDREPDQEYIDRRNAWGRACRYELKSRSAKGYDSPSLVVERILRTGDRTSRLAKAWFDWDDVRHRNPPDTVARWISDDMLLAALRFEKGPQLVWYDSIAVAERLVKLGIPTLMAGEPVPEENMGRYTLALSLRSHGVGWNLQAWFVNTVIEPPSSGLVWEQFVGRTHRAGQEADTVYIHVPFHTDVFISGIEKAKEEEVYVQQTQGLPRRLVYGDYENVLKEKKAHG